MERQMPSGSLIKWLPIADMPLDRKDGRNILLWCDGEPQIGVWEVRLDGSACWSDSSGYGPLPEPLCWADINAPNLMV